MQHPVAAWDSATSATQMPRLPSRPHVTLRVPAQIVLGERFVATVVLRSAAPTPVDFVDLTVTRECAGLPPLELVARLRGKGTLTQGEHRLTAEMALPEEGPPSYSGKGFVRYVARVHVSVPWWPDRRSDFLLTATPPSWPPRAPKALLFSPHPQGASAGVPSYECTLTDSLLVPGGTLAGVLALSNRENVDYRSASVSLVGREEPPNGTDPVDAFRIRYELPIAPTKRQVRFRLQLPDDLYPTWRGKGYRLNWLVEVRANAKRGKTIAGLVPVEVAPRGTPVSEAPRSALPSIGDARVERVWQEVAAAQGFALEGDRLVLRRDDISVLIHRWRGAQTRLMAHLEFPSLSLHLDGGLKQGFRRFLSPGLDISLLPWRSRSYVSGRDLEQVRHVIDTLAEACFDSSADEARARFERRIRLDDLSDDTVVLSVANAGTTHAPLSRFAAAALRVLDAATRLPASTPAPESFAANLDHWRSVARTLNAPLETTHMGIRGRRGGSRVCLRTRWTADGTCLDTLVSVSTPARVRDKCCFVHASATSLSSLPDAVGPAARALLDALGEKVDGVEVKGDEVLAWMAPNAPQEALETVDLLLSLAAALRTGDGPFR